MTHDCLDLLYKMLTVDHAKRITAKEAMQHPYFEKVRADVDIVSEVPLII